MSTCPLPGAPPAALAAAADPTCSPWRCCCICGPEFLQLLLVRPQLPLQLLYPPLLLLHLALQLLQQAVAAAAALARIMYCLVRLEQVLREAAQGVGAPHLQGSMSDETDG